MGQLNSALLKPGFQKRKGDLPTTHPSILPLIVLKQDITIVQMFSRKMWVGSDTIMVTLLRLCYNCLDPQRYPFRESRRNRVESLGSKERIRHILWLGAQSSYSSLPLPPQQLLWMRNVAKPVHQLPELWHEVYFLPRPLREMECLIICSIVLSHLKI